MVHHHHHHHHHHTHKIDQSQSRPTLMSDKDQYLQTQRNLMIALLINFVFAGVEIGGGMWTQSVAILADAVHDLGDCLTLSLAIVLERLSVRSSSAAYSYGYRRLSLLASALTSVMLTIGAMAMMIQALLRIVSPQLPHAEGMMGLAVLGIVANAFAAWRLNRGHSLNERAASWHMIEDVFGWVAILIGAIAIRLTGLAVIDSVLALIFSSIVMVGVMRTLRSVLRLFLQATPEGFDASGYQSQILALAHVKGVHDLHVWSMDGQRHVMTIHVVVSQQCPLFELSELKKKMRAILLNAGASHVTIEIEFEGEDCPDIDCVSTHAAHS